MKHIYLISSFFIILSLFGVEPVFSQGETDNWYFGNSSALNFSGPNPVPISGSAMNTFEGVASISNSAGQVLFYTDGKVAYNRNNVPMANGTGLFGSDDATQSAVVVPQPGNDSLYYLFTCDKKGGTKGICYSVINTHLSNNLGAVTAVKNVNLLPQGNSTERLTAVRHCNNNDVWIITRLINSNEYYAWLLTANGITSNPVISTVSNFLNATGSGFSPQLGYLKSSPTGNKLAAQICTNDYIELTDFSNITGVVSNLIKIKCSPPPIVNVSTTSANINVMNYGVEFSPNGNLLYGNILYSNGSPAMSINSSWILYQFNITSNDSALIEATRFQVDSFQANIAVYSASGALQLAKNGKIYCTHYNKTSLSAVNQPNIQGAGCSFSRLSVPLPLGGIGQAGLPNFLQSYLSTNNTFNFTFSNNCIGRTVSFAFNNPPSADSVRWFFGDLPTGPMNTDTTTTPYHMFSSDGIFQVKLVVYKKNFSTCEAATDTIVKNIGVISTALDLGNDTTLCGNSSISLQVPPSNGASYLWSNTATTSSITVATAGTYWLRRTVGNCISSDTIIISPSPIFSAGIGLDRIRCIGDTVHLASSPSAGASYLWNTGSTNPQITVDTTGFYILSKTIGSCTKYDTAFISFVTKPALNLGLDRGACDGDIVNLADTLISPSGTTWSWSTGSVNSSINVALTGSYILTKSLGECHSRDTVVITFVPSASLNLGPDKFACTGDTFTLDATTPGNYQYQWNTGSTNPQIHVSTAGTYIISRSGGGCIKRDTLIITYRPGPLVNLGNDTTLCFGNLLTLNNRSISIPQASNFWNNGSNQDSIKVGQTGRYWLEQEFNGCVKSDTIDITFLPLPSTGLLSSERFCPGDSINIGSSDSTLKYLWSTGDSSNQITVSTAGRYWLTVVDTFGCKKTDTTTVTLLPLPYVRLIEDTTICYGTVLVLNPFLGNVNDVMWQDGSNINRYEVSSKGKYSIVGSNKCGFTEDSVFIDYRDCELFIPNTFTPNGDGNNDIFKIMGATNNLSNLKIMIANRWGQIVFKSNDPSFIWDGTFKGTKVEVGTYVYYITYKKLNVAEDLILKGSVHIMY